MELVRSVRARGGEGIDALLPELAGEGVAAIEWHLGYHTFAREVSAEAVVRLESALSETGVRLHSLHAPFGERADLSSLEPEVQRATAEAYAKTVGTAGRLGVRTVVMHPGMAPRGPRIREGLECAAEALRGLARTAGDLGVMLAVENLPPEYPGHSPYEVLRLVQAAGSPHVGVCFDWGHAHTCGDAPGFARQLLGHAVLVHVHDNDGIHDQHLWPGQGSAPWPAFARARDDSGSSTALVLECRPPEGWQWGEAVAEVLAFLGEAGADSAAAAMGLAPP